MYILTITARGSFSSTVTLPQPQTTGSLGSQFKSASVQSPTPLVVNTAENLAIASSAAMPDPTVPVDPALASYVPEPDPPETQQISYNNDGSLACHWLSRSPNPCIDAWKQYDDNYVYHGYTSYVHERHFRNINGEVYPDWPYGCTTIFNCDDDAAYEVGMTGKQIKNW